MKEQKLKFSDKIRKRYIKKNLREKKNFDIYKEIKKTELKYDTEIMELAWEVASKKEYEEFPIDFQIKKAQENIENLRFCSHDVQRILGESPETISKCNEEMQYNISVGHASLLKYCNEKVQNSALELDPNFIVCCNEEVRNKALEDIQSPCWRPFIKSTKDFQEIFTRLSSSRITPEIKREYWAEFYNSRSVEEIEDMMKQCNSNADIYYNIQQYLQYCNFETQDRFFERRSDFKYVIGETWENEEKNNYIYGFFSEEFFRKKFILKYGERKHFEYSTLITELYTNPPQYNNEIRNHIFREFLTNQTLVKNVDYQKIINYIRFNNTMLNEDSTKDYDKHCQDFRSIIYDAYGEKAMKILESRPGLDWENIFSTEVFSKEVIENFREGFVHDLLSYNFKDIDQFIRIVKNPEDLEAFKLYYGRMSQSLGENAVTMEMCMSRYNEYSDILKQATQTQLNEMQKKKLDELCSWRKNICGITRLEELPMLENMLQTKILELSQDENPEQIAKKDEELFGKDIFDLNIESENILYNYQGLVSEDMECLTEEERKTFKFFQQSFSKEKGYIINNKFGNINLQKLRNACKEGIPISSIFINKYKAFNKIKEQEMTKFRKELTNRKKIDQAIEKGEYGVRKIEIDGVEIIDLGDMPSNFAVHAFNMGVNSYADGENAPKPDDYLKYDKMNGISTISAKAQSENGEKWDTTYMDKLYVYWDFEDNEIVGLVDNPGELSDDAQVSHRKRLIKSFSNKIATTSLKRYKNLQSGKEIAFYRRYRDHARIEKEKYGGKVIPSAIVGDPTDPKIIKISQERFEKSIPILCKRGLLSHEENIRMIRDCMKSIKEKDDITKGLKRTYQREIIEAGEVKKASQKIRDTITYKEKKEECQTQEEYR